METSTIAEKDIPRADTVFIPTMELRFYVIEYVVNHPDLAFYKPAMNPTVITKSTLQQKHVGQKFGTIKWVDVPFVKED